MDAFRPIDAEAREAATTGLLEALTALLSTGADALADLEILSRTQQLQDLCDDASTLCAALAVINRRSAP